MRKWQWGGGIIAALMAPAAVSAALAGGTAWYSDAQSWLLMSASLTDLVGARRGDFIVPGVAIREQLDLAMSGAPDPEIPVSGGFKLRGSGRLHSDTEGGALVVDDGNRVVYAGLLSHRCHWQRGGGASLPECDTAPHLTIFARSMAPPAVISAFADWAASHPTPWNEPGEVSRGHDLGLITEIEIDPR